ncbi:MAG: hypothetical protein HQ582_01925 [Planctomycetes bacterium]|nr:hypothetical protein [Planctomycetota bacterium]
MQAFALGFGADNGVPLIPREGLPEEISAMAAEESDFWKGRSIPIQLMVELPFWLMIPDCEISIAHGGATVRVRIRGKYMAVSDGPLFYDSHRNVVFIGPNDDLKAGEELPPVVARTEAAIYRPMKTVVVFRPEVMEDAVVALQEPVSATQQELREVRRVNRAAQYLQSLAYAHVPLLNRLITDYRLASRDPCAFQVSQWNVPVWFAEYNDKLVRVCLMPYSDNDWYPALRRLKGGERPPFYAASPHVVGVQTGADVAPGTLEILDARSLMYRGHVADAVRSAVTAIEVALEGQIAKLLTHNGWTEQQIQSRLEETWNDFDERVADYERISGTRIPGPVLSCLPHINGIRLKSELSCVRRLRHKIVHEGLRVNSHSRGAMVRAIETMTWLFHWLSWEEGKAQEKSRSYVFFEMMRGMGIPRYSVTYRDSGVVVLPDGHRDEQATTDDELIRLQYLATIESNEADIELFTLMSFAYLGIDAEDAPAPVDDAVVHERYHINHKEHNAIVFCFECDGLFEPSTIEAVASRLRECGRHHEGICSALCIINHQKNRPIGRREVEGAIPDEVNQIATRFAITLITAQDLRFLVQGTMEYGWDIDRIKNLMFVPGRQGKVPPAYRRVGACVHFYGRRSVMSVELEARETAETGKILGLRLAAGYHEEPIESLQVEHRTVPAATGPCRVGIKTNLRRSDVAIGQAVFIRLA